MTRVAPSPRSVAVVGGILGGEARGPGAATGILVAVVALALLAWLVRGPAAFVLVLVALALLGSALTQRARHGLAVSPVADAVAQRAHVAADATLIEDPDGPRFTAAVLARVQRLDGHDAGDRTVLLEATGDATSRLRVLGAGDRVKVDGPSRRSPGTTSGTAGGTRSASCASTRSPGSCRRGR